MWRNVTTSSALRPNDDVEKDISTSVIPVDSIKKNLLRTLIKL